MTNPAKHVTTHRLSPEVFEQLEKQFRPLVVNESTSALQAGVAIGRQEVLNALRRGFTVEVTHAPTR